MDAPFIIAAHSPGNFSIPLGLITNFSIKKGGKNNLWNAIERVSRQITIQMEVADLYDVLPVPYSKTNSKGDNGEVYGKYDENLRAFLGEGVIGADFSDVRISEVGMSNMASKSMRAFGTTGGIGKASSLIDKIPSDYKKAIGNVLTGDSNNENSLSSDFSSLVDSAKSWFK
jgi:hypothetical protein